jgi:GDP-mannose 6-dehydrogenase
MKERIERMQIAVVGMGYVGTVSAAYFAAAGHKVWGIDINEEKIRIINSGKTPIVEPDLGEKVALGRRTDLLRGTCNLREGLDGAEVCFVAVATPSLASGGIDATHLLRACQQIAAVVTELGQPLIVAIRSSILPSVFEQCAASFSAMAPGLVQLCVNPEFLREGSAIADFENPPFTLLGLEEEGVESTLRSLYQQIPATVVVLPPKAALMVKYASNSFHALKTAFANEIGTLCAEAGVDGRAVMSVFCRDTKLNISERYLRPGFAFGGSCLPKDVRALLHVAKRHDLNLPLVSSLLASNEAVIDRAVQQILDTRVRRIGLIGLAFKSNTDDLRESPFVELAEHLLGKGRELRIYDPNVSIARISGANRQYINEMIPHLSRILVGSPQELADSELLVVGHRYPEAEALLGTPGIPVIELGVASGMAPSAEDLVAVPQV